MTSARRIRYRVTYWDDNAPDVSYNCLLGDNEARRFALYNGRNHGGRVVAEYADGVVEEIMPFGGGFGSLLGSAMERANNPSSQPAKAA